MGIVLRAILRGVLLGCNNIMLMRAIWHLHDYNRRKTYGFAPATAWEWTKIIFSVIYVMANIVVIGTGVTILILLFLVY